MKAIIAEVPEHMLIERKRTGADRWDEMWEGVLHMTAAPNKRHTRLQVQMHNWLAAEWARPRGNQVDLLVNVASVGGWPHDYRIPDIVLLTADRFSIDHDDYYEGAPTVVIEIRSPGDETWEKMSFYSNLGVPEVWVVDRDTKMPQVFQLTQGEYRELPRAAEGWVYSPVTGVALRGELGSKLGIQMADNTATFKSLPLD
jgi:Uma2 family endonuclease